ncbi:MAG: type II toxin-antitoxin system HicB family antitoxin [Bryobacter sp.]
MRVMRYTAIFEHADQSWGACVPDLPGLAVVGDSKEEVATLLEEAIQLHLEALLEAGYEIPEPHSQAAEIEVPKVA